MGGGISSEDVTAKTSDILVGKTALTSDSGDELTTGILCSDATLDASASLTKDVIAYGKDGSRIVGSMESMNGGTFTPNASQQTIQCAGKKMNSNIVIGAVPSSYVATNNAYIYNWGWGNLVNKGVVGYYPNQQGGGTIIKYNATTNLVARGDDGRLRYSMAGSLSKPAAFTTGGTIDMTPFKKFRIKWYAYTLSSGSHYWYVLMTDSTKQTRKFYDLMNYAGAVTSTSYSEVAFDISGVNGHCFVSVYITSGGSMTSMGVEYIKLTTS